MPANIPLGSDGGLWFLVAFGAITWFVSVSRCFGASTILHQRRRLFTVLLLQSD